jgi:hypothetical protein
MDNILWGASLALFAAGTAWFALAVVGAALYAINAFHGEKYGDGDKATAEEMAVITAAMHEHLGKKQ